MKKDKGSLVFRAVELKTSPVSVGSWTCEVWRWQLQVGCGSAHEA